MVSLNNIEKIQLSMMVAIFSGNLNATIISCSSAASTNDETDLNELSSFVFSIPKYNVLITSGDMNAQKNKDKNNKYCEHNSSNRNGEHLTGFSLKNGLTFLNTKFQKSGVNYGPTPTQIMLKSR